MGEKQKEVSCEARGEKRTEEKVIHTENTELKIIQMVKEENNSNVLIQIFLKE